MVLTAESTNALGEGDDVVVEGEAVRVTDEAALRTLARLRVEKYGENWTFEVRDGVFAHAVGEALVFRVAPRKAFGFPRGSRTARPAPEFHRLTRVPGSSLL
ncbi:hypothetical protein ACLB9X_02050 [Streptomyces sp. 5K101]|uniref:hypothetical protein n=1 Tax=Streptomyces sp. 5K101 TaxID=3390037 RepID=UPI00397586A8